MVWYKCGTKEKSAREHPLPTARTPSISYVGKDASSVRFQPTAFGLIGRSTKGRTWIHRVKADCIAVMLCPYVNPTILLRGAVGSVSSILYHIGRYYKNFIPSLIYCWWLEAVVMCVYQTERSVTIVRFSLYTFFKRRIEPYADFSVLMSTRFKKFFSASDGVINALYANIARCPCHRSVAPLETIIEVIKMNDASIMA